MGNVYEERTAVVVAVSEEVGDIFEKIVSNSKFNFSMSADSGISEVGWFDIKKFIWDLPKYEYVDEFRGYYVPIERLVRACFAFEICDKSLFFSFNLSQKEIEVISKFFEQFKIIFTTKMLVEMDGFNGHEYRDLEDYADEISN